MAGTIHEPTTREGSCRGIIFRLYPYSDTSLIFHVLSEELGLISLIAKGARRLNSSFAGKLDLFYLCQFEFIPSRKSDLHTLKEVQLVDAHPNLTRNYELLCDVNANARALERLIERGIPVPELFALFSDYLKYLPTHAEPKLGNILFRIRLLALLGNAPKFDRMRLSEERMGLILNLLEMNWEELLALAPGKEDLQFLERVAEAHLRDCSR
jgi:DNA repair protein RecO (recombination protein O)